MNKAFTPSKLLISVVAVAALLGGCKKNEVTTAPTADTSMTTPATTTATTPSTTGMTTPTPSTSDTTGSSGMTGSTAAGTSTPSDSAVTGTNGTSGASGTMPGMSKDPANDASKPAVRNNSGQTQGTTGSSLPTSDGSR